MAPILPFLPLITTGLGAITGIAKTISASNQGKKEEDAIEAAEAARKKALETVGTPGSNSVPAPLSNSIGPTGTLGTLGGGSGLGGLNSGPRGLGGLGTLNGQGDNQKSIEDYLKNSQYGFGKNKAASSGV